MIRIGYAHGIILASQPKTGQFFRLKNHACYPNLMIRGESNYEESYGIISQVSFERKDNGIIFSKRCEDPDFIIAMDEEGVPLEKIAEMTGLPVEELEALLGYTVDEDAEYEEY